jgi:hypothetical protein
VGKILPVRLIPPVRLARFTPGNSIVECCLYGEPDYTYTLFHGDGTATITLPTDNTSAIMQTFANNVNKKNAAKSQEELLKLQENYTILHHSGCKWNKSPFRASAIATGGP